MTSDPVRLLEDPTAGAVLRGDLVHAAEAELHGLDLAAGLAALQKATATVTSSTTVVAGTSLLTKLGIGAAGVAVAAVALWLGLGDPERPQAPTGAATTERAAAAPSPNASQSPVASVEQATPPASSTAERMPAAARVEAPATPVPSEVVQVEPAPMPSEPKPSTRRKGATGDRPSTSAENAGSADAGSAAVDSVLREAKLVAKARSNLTRDPARALALAEEAERDFPEGQLVEERRAIAIRALVALGRLDEAQRRAEPFLAEYGRGAHAAAVRRALDDGAEAP